jgi:chromosome segregation ATPase
LVEQAMFFLAGLLVAGLAGLLALPAFARRALRLSEARARMLAPMSMKEVVAERDLLRAEHAVEQHRLERRLIAAQDAVAHQRADVGRHIATLVALEGEAGKKDIEIGELRDEAAAKRLEISGLEGDLGASQLALNDLSLRLERAASEISSLKDRRMALEILADDQRTVIAGLETRASGLEMNVGDAVQKTKTMTASAEGERQRLSMALAARVSEIARLNAELNEALAKGAMVVGGLDTKDAELQQARRRIGELETALTAKRSAEEEAAARASADVRMQGDAALREAISRLAADVVRLSGPAVEVALISRKPGKNRRRESAAPSSQGPEAPKGLPPSQARQLQPTAPER